MNDQTAPEPIHLISKTEFGRRCVPPMTRQGVDKAIASGHIPGPVAQNLMNPDDVAVLNEKRAADKPSALKSDHELKRAHLIAQTKRESALAKKAEMEAAALAGELLYREDVEALQTEMVMSARAKLLAMATRIAAEVAGKFGADEAEIQAVVKKLVDEALSELSEYDPEKYARYAKSKGRKVAEGTRAREPKSSRVGEPSEASRGVGESKSSRAEGSRRVQESKSSRAEEPESGRGNPKSNKVAPSPQPSPPGEGARKPSVKNKNSGAGRSGDGRDKDTKAAGGAK